MANKKTGVYSKKLSFSDSKTTDLYLIIDHHNIYLSVKDFKKGQFVAIEHFTKNSNELGWTSLFDAIQKQAKLYSIQYRNIALVWNDRKFILSKKMQLNDALNYQQELNLVHGVNNNDEFIVNTINNEHVIAYHIPDQLMASMLKLFPKGVWHHFSEYIFKNDFAADVHLFLFDNQYCIKIIKDGVTQLINYFPLENDTQNIYHVLNSCTHTNLDTHKATIKVWGYQADKHQFVNALAPYFSTGKIVEPDENWEEKDNCPDSIYTTYLIF